MRVKCLGRLSLVLVLGVGWIYPQADDWTVSIEVSRSDPGGTSRRAYLWVPPEAANGVRGLIMCAKTSSEERFVEDPVIRAVAAQQRLALIFFHPSTVSLPDEAGANLVQQTLKRLADESGYPEIEHAPWLTFGHSTSSHFALKMAYWKPERTIGVIVHKGGLVPPAGWEGHELEGIPTLALQGQYEEFPINGGDHGTTESVKLVVADVLSLRGHNNGREYLIAPLIAPGEGHMAYAYRHAPLLAMFIRKACEKRLPVNSVARSAPVTLRSVGMSTGWLGDTDLLGDVTKMRVDSFPEFSEPGKKFWFLDREFAQAWLALVQQLKKERQTLGTAGNRPQFSPQVDVKWSSGSRTYTSNLTVGEKYKVTASTSKGLPAKMYVQAGPGYIQDGFLYADPCMLPDDNTIRIVLTSDGSSALSVADRMIRSKVLERTKGVAQSISFSTPSGKAAIGDTLKLDAKASSGLPIRYKVISGPGKIVGEHLVVTSFTARSGRTRIHVRACQEGDAHWATAPVLGFDIQVEDEGVTGLLNAPPSGFDQKPPPWGLFFPHAKRLINGRLVY